MADLETTEEVTTDEETEDTETVEDTETTEEETETEDDTSETETTLADEIIEDLTVELSITDEEFNADLLAVKVKSAIRDVKKARRYYNNSDYYTDEVIESDLENYYSNIRAIALYDYNIVGAEGQSASNENSISRTYVDRNSLFVGVIPIASV